MESPVRCLPLEDWPEPDRAAWERALRDDDLMEETGLFARLKPLTIATLSSHHGRWQYFLATRDPAALAQDPATRITRERVARYIEDLCSRNASVTVANCVLGLERTARAFAPEGDWRWLRKLVNRLYLRAKPVRNRRAQLRPPQEVFHAALQLMKTAETGAFTSAKKRGLAYRDATILALLASRGLRLGIWDRSRSAGIFIGWATVGCSGSTIPRPRTATRWSLFYPRSSPRQSSATSIIGGRSCSPADIRAGYGDVLEATVLDALRHRLMDPELFKLFVTEFTAEWNRLQADAGAGSRPSVASSPRSGGRSRG